MGRRPTPSSPLNPFYGYPEELIAEWCCVSVQTARLYKTGRRRPSKRVLKLFRLYRERRVLTDEWGGHKVIGDRLYAPNGVHFEPSHLVLWGLVRQALREKDPDAYEELLRRADMV